MIEFEFKTSPESKVFCVEIAKQMCAQFGISDGEAIRRINRDWKGLDLSQPDEIIFHEDEDYWAKTIYYGKDSHWWSPNSNPIPRPAP